MTTEKLIKLRQNWIKADAAWYRLQKQQAALNERVEIAAKKQEAALKAVNEAFAIWRDQDTVTD